ncbi:MULTISPECIES: hypothetical protein [Xanthomonas]|uniref:hypothetical protein n=1 Tax=Xanthomonas TaxID=338 RepID=UPI001ADB4406|nr:MULTISPECIES: hypothetical protein [unclassified Xanthomonas]MBO9875680.1 hypothetical protein [Xanthomonas sp. D-93]WNH43357.1 hypothetical protein PG878_12515 [Xanthomonas sp. A6251]
MAPAYRALAIAAQLLSWGGYVLGMLLLYLVSGSPYAWVDGTDPQLSSASFQDSGNGRLVGLCVLATLLLWQGVHALLSRRRTGRLCCLGAMVVACVAWVCWN